MKCNVSMDVDSFIILDGIIIKGNIHNSAVLYSLVDTVRNF